VNVPAGVRVRHADGGIRRDPQGLVGAPRRVLLEANGEDPSVGHVDHQERARSVQDDVRRKRDVWMASRGGRSLEVVSQAFAENSVAPHGPREHPDGHGPAPIRSHPQVAVRICDEVLAQLEPPSRPHPAKGPPVRLGSARDRDG
jgi:hypothetical protein